VPSGIARPLVESLQHEVVCRENDVARYVPDPPGGLTGVDRAIALALERIHDGEVTTRWSSASVPGSPSDPLPSDPEWAGGSLYADERDSVVDAPRGVLWSVVEEIGGEQGWYSWSLAWRARGLLDRLVGGPGLRRGRRDDTRLVTDDVVDFWRVEVVEPGRRLLLRAEMRLPGLAWLELRTEDGPGEGRSVFVQRALFSPRGLAGHLYWWAVAPFHGVVFGGMQRNVTAEAERRASGVEDGRRDR
jgi:hypothetical protein